MGVASADGAPAALLKLLMGVVVAVGAGHAVTVKILEPDPVNVKCVEGCSPGSDSRLDTIIALLRMTEDTLVTIVTEDHQEELLCYPSTIYAFYVLQNGFPRFYWAPRFLYPEPVHDFPQVVDTVTTTLQVGQYSLEAAATFFKAAGVSVDPQFPTNLGIEFISPFFPGERTYNCPGALQDAPPTDRLDLWRVHDEFG